MLFMIEQQSGISSGLAAPHSYLRRWPVRLLQAVSGGVGFRAKGALAGRWHRAGSARAVSGVAAVAGRAEAGRLWASSCSACWAHFAFLMFACLLFELLSFRKRIAPPKQLFSLRDPAEADWSLFPGAWRFEAGRLRSWRTWVKYEKSRSIVCVTWSHFGIHFGVRIFQKSLRSQAGTIKNQVGEPFLVTDMSRRLSGSALGRFDSVPDLILGWF